MKLLTLLLILFGIAVSAIPVNFMTPTDSALQPRMTGCQNAQCWDYQGICTNNGDSTSDKNIQVFISSFCTRYDGHMLNAGTNLTQYGDHGGIKGFLAVRNYASDGAWLMDMNLCMTGFGDVLKKCEPNGAGTDTKGGYIWMAYKQLTFVIGINGNAPTTFCNIFWTNFC
ncbi:hypothetical protein LTR78_003537 [Recurvomyces mirabilis]|uniref:Uncharacterized protein n=1 Tax=Recurvomyces mirabilis TaxID=574656 RepID=A0AAE1C3P0_9PEZI|nr:hypothetical protein LTR78_003537 [Recurvomyces mirabilis]KAK5154432.1 hypothetical protein LTS14_006567 [Recurvomyces mirabilis]